MKLALRTARGAAPIAVALTLAVTVGASAQVASLTGPDETPDSQTTETLLEFEDQNEAILAYAQCLRDNGIDVDDPQQGRAGVGDKAGLAASKRECRRHARRGNKRAVRIEIAKPFR